MEERNNWIIVVQDSNCSGADAVRVNGSLDQVKEYITQIVLVYKEGIKIGQKENTNAECTETSDQVQVWDKGNTLRGYADLKEGHLEVIASIEKDPVVL